MQRKGAWTTVWPPISLCYCASLLEKSRHEVRITDCSVEDSGTSDIKRNLSEFRPNLVVINTATVSIANDLNFAGIVKSLLPDATVAALGIHVTALP